MIQIERLAKSYGDLQAVKSISLEVGKGEIYGLIGPNGAGKTTTLSMMSGLLAPDSGRVLVGGLDIWKQPGEVKRALGVVPQQTAVYEELSARDNLRFWASLYGLSGKPLRDRVDAVLSQVGLGARARERVGRYSGGMKRRLNLALGLVHRPRALLLDEPTVGIDPRARGAILELIREEAAGGVTVFYTTHHLEEAQEICDRLAIMDRGEILAEGTVAELTESVNGGDVVTFLGEFTTKQMADLARLRDDVSVVGLEDGRAVLSLRDARRKIPRLLEEFTSRGLPIESISVKKADLRDVFMKLTGREPTS